MKSKAKIKVIKKKKLKMIKLPVITEAPSKETTTREMVSTVSDWVKEFQKQRNQRNTQSFENLFSQKPQTA